LSLHTDSWVEGTSEIQLSAGRHNDTFVYNSEYKQQEQDRLTQDASVCRGYTAALRAQLSVRRRY